MSDIKPHNLACELQWISNMRLLAGIGLAGLGFAITMLYLALTIIGGL